MGAENSATRAQLIDAAAQILRSEGATAVTARRLAELVGLRRHIVHYYFGTIEDLFVAVLERDSSRTREWLAKALASDDPLKVIWNLGSSAAATTLEFFALASRHELVREAFKQYSEEFRKCLALALERHLQIQGITPRLPAAATTIVLQSVAYSLSIEQLLNIREGHDAMRDSLDTLISALIEPVSGN
ncbi:MAG: TetR/AcrR family transcriptional regulator [Novosphingobium sp.]|nr:TetR/AcrR family transcriptional regulator [Novosphingobium sp.]